uniref:Fork-head domain-containing protein n=1 Tax=Anopheles arabiensis TaxID=7173 RepID=A0A182I8D5_ANOAR
MNLVITMEVPSEGPGTYCRLCLSRCGLRQIFSMQASDKNVWTSNNSSELVEKIYECTNIQLSSAADAECAICGRCLLAVQDFYHFRVRSNKVNELIQNLTIATDKVESVPVPLTEAAIGNQYQCANCLAKFHHIRSLRQHHKLFCIAKPKTSDGTLIIEHIDEQMESESVDYITPDDPPIPAPVAQPVQPAKQSMEPQEPPVMVDEPVEVVEQGVKTFPRPPYSFSCLIGLALKNSHSGLLPVPDIYSFVCEHFPYFRTAPRGWKNSLRHNLSLSKCFKKIEKPLSSGAYRKCFFWMIKPDKQAKLDEAVQRWFRREPDIIRQAMAHPEYLTALERGEMKHGSVLYDHIDLEDDLDEDDGEEDDDVEFIEPEHETLDDDAERYIIATLDAGLKDDDDDDDNEEEMPKWSTANRQTIQLPMIEPGQIVANEIEEEEYLELEEEGDNDGMEIIEPKHETIQFDADRSIIKMPELVIHGEDEEGGHQVNFNLEVPDYYASAKVDSKHSMLALAELTEEDLVSLENEDEFLLKQPQKHRQQTEQQNSAKRVSNDTSETGVSFQQHFEQLQKQQYRLRKHSRQLRQRSTRRKVPLGSRLA